MDETMSLDELDTVAHAFELAIDYLGMNIAIVHSKEINLLRTMVLFTAKQHKRQAESLDSDDAMVIGHEASSLFRRLRAARS